MPLQKRTIDVAFQRGQDESVTRKLLPQGTFARIHNAQWDKSGSLRTADGYVNYGEPSDDAPHAFAKDGNTRVAINSDGVSRSVGTDNDDYTDVDDVHVVGAAVREAIAGEPGGAIIQDYYRAPSGHHVVSVSYQDSRTNDVIFLDPEGKPFGQIGSGSGAGNVLQIDGSGDIVYVFRTTSGARSISRFRINDDFISTLNPSISLSTVPHDPDTQSFCVVESSGTEVYGVVTWDTGSAVGFERVGLVNGTASGSTTVASAPDGRVGCCRDNGGTLAMVAWTQGGFMRFAEYDPSTNTATAGSTQVVSLSGDVYVGVDENGGLGEVVAVVEGSLTRATQAKTSIQAIVDLSGSPSLLTSAIYGYSLASHPFGTFPQTGSFDTTWYAWAVNDSDTATAVLLDLTAGGKVIGRYAPGTSIRRGVPKVKDDGSGVLRTAIAEKYTAESAVAAVVSVAPDDPQRALSVEAAGTPHLSGGVAMQVGTSVATHGFTEPPHAALSLSAGALTGDYIYAVTAVRRDRNGDEWESQPRLLTTSPSSQDVTVFASIPTTEDADALRIYRTRDGEATLRLLHEEEFTWRSVTSVTHVDDAADSTLGTARLIYTTGNVLENDPPSGFLHLAEHNQRLFGALGNRLWWTKTKVYGEGWSWSWSQYRDLSQELTALASLDDALIIWSDTDCWALTGDGPTRQGAGEFQIRNLADVGCLDPRSVVVTPDAVYWQSRRGIETMGRDLFPQYVGGPVEDSLTTVTATAHDPERRCVYFFQGDDDCLVWDYGEGGWTTESQTARSAVFVGGDTWVVDTSTPPAPAKREAVTRLEAAAAVIETGRFSLGQAVNGYGRIYSTTIMAEGPSSGTAYLRVSTSYDDGATWEHAKTWTVDSGGSKRFRYSHARQRCDGFAHRLEMWGDAMSVQSMSLEVGSSRGPTRVAQSGRK